MLARLLSAARRTFERSRAHLLPPQRSRNELHDYWRAPDADNDPRTYLSPAAEKRSQFLVELLRRHVDTDARILEVGCNAGRNLAYLWDAGFHKLQAIEINPKAVELLRSSHPKLADVTILNMPIEEAVPLMPEAAHDVVFTMAVLEHVHRDSEWVFSHLARTTARFLVTIEDEKNVSERHFPRNYRRVFEPLGFSEIESVSDLRPYGLTPDFVARVFAKKT